MTVLTGGNLKFCAQSESPRGPPVGLYGRLLKSARVRWSELKLEGELDRAGATDLVEGVEAAIGAAGAQTVC